MENDIQDNLITVRCKFKRFVWQNDEKDFAIASFEPLENVEGLQVDRTFNTFVVKGDFPSIIDKVNSKGTVIEYKLSFIEEEEGGKYGKQYTLIQMLRDIEIDRKDKKSIKVFLETVTTIKRAKALMDTLDNPIEVIENADIVTLLTVEGIGHSTAEKIIKAYDETMDYSYAFVKMYKYGITIKTAKKIINHYKSVDLALEKLENNPYDLSEIEGIGFMMCDDIFMSGYEDDEERINSPKRIDGFLRHVLLEEEMNGNTWITPKQLMSAVVDFIPNVNKKVVGQVISDNDKYLILGKKHICLKETFELELEVAIHLNRILYSAKELEYKGFDEQIAKSEKEQGWTYTDEQKRGMAELLKNPITIVEGYAGTGKSTLLKEILFILSNNGYTFCQSALSGSASANLTKITGVEGYTIHRLLGLGLGKNGGFLYHEDNKLPYHIYVIDEFSMVDLRLFLRLVRAIPNGAKIFITGDSEQLDSIGIPIMKPMIKSSRFSHVMLKDVHRQAKKSAITMQSMSIRNGELPSEIQNKVGKSVYGELKDMEYNIVNDDEHIMAFVMKEFVRLIKDNSINDIQIICPTRIKGKANGYDINVKCQTIYNPLTDGDKSITVKVRGDKKKTYDLRANDRVVNTKNFKGVKLVDSIDTVSINNGNVGVITEILSESMMRVDFDGIGEVVIDKKIINKLELGYCISVHKSQGIGVNNIILALPYNFKMVSRQLYYTSITRAKKLCLVVSRYHTLKRSVKVNANSKKQTFLKQLLTIKNVDKLIRMTKQYK